MDDGPRTVGTAGDAAARRVRHGPATEEEPDVPDIVTMQLDAVQSLAAQLTDLGAELAVEGGSTRAEGVRLGQSLTGPAAEELAVAGTGWAELVDALGDRARAVATGLEQAVASYRALDGLLTQRMGAAPHAAIAR